MSKLEDALARLERDLGTGDLSVVDTDDLRLAVEAAAAVAKGYSARRLFPSKPQDDPTLDHVSEAVNYVRDCAVSSVHSDPESGDFFILAPSGAVSLLLRYLEKKDGR